MAELLQLRGKAKITMSEPAVTFLMTASIAILPGSGGVAPPALVGLSPFCSEGTVRPGITDGSDEKSRGLPLGRPALF